MKMIKNQNTKDKIKSDFSKNKFMINLNFVRLREGNLVII
jgi:hypothetical protein